jgi:hypothetical protein
MSSQDTRKSFPFNRPGNYRICVQGILDKSWSGKLGGMNITECRRKDQKGSVTELVGKVRDQAELAGVLNTLYEQHLTLLSVKYIDSD